MKGLMVYVKTDELVKLSVDNCVVAFGEPKLVKLKEGADVFIFNKEKGAIVAHGIYTGENPSYEDNKAIYGDLCKDTWETGVRTRNHNMNVSLKLDELDLEEQYHFVGKQDAGMPKKYVSENDVEKIKSSLRTIELE